MISEYFSGRKTAFLSLGCKVNAYETDSMKMLFEEQGAVIVDFAEKADIYVINTCTVTNIADRKSRQMLHRAKQRNPEAVVIAVGCYAQAAGEELLNDDAVDLIVGNSMKSSIIHYIEAYLEKKTNNTLTSMLRETNYDKLPVGETIEERCRAYVKIQDGCNQFCSYCIIPFVRGRVRSRQEEDIVNEVITLTHRGYKEIVLTGIHISSYGLDDREYNDTGDDRDETLLRLILRLCKIDGLKRIRLSSLEPRIITDRFVKALAGEEKVCPHFHLSLQSGSAATLERMNRKYTPAEYYDRCMTIRKYYNRPAITTDVIVGFPGETEKEFKETEEFIQKVNFSQMHLFKYSKRKGTKAAIMQNQVADSIKTERSGELQKLNEELHVSYLNGFLGSVERVLVEECIEINGEKYSIGHNERYVRIGCRGGENLINSIISIKIDTIEEDNLLLGKCLDN